MGSDRVMGSRVIRLASARLRVTMSLWLYDDAVLATH